MKKTIQLREKKIDYTLKISKRAKRMRLAVYCDGSCIVTVPPRVPESIIEKFLVEKSRWLIDKITYFGSSKNIIKNNNKEEYLKYKSQALKLVEERISYFNTFYGYKWNKISIKNQKTRWGSCSKKGNLNFNYKLVLLPKKAADYVIVHELCHLREFNHSQRFWNLVSQTFPDYKEIRNLLKAEAE